MPRRVHRDEHEQSYDSYSRSPHHRCYSTRENCDSPSPQRSRSRSPRHDKSRRLHTGPENYGVNSAKAHRGM